MRLGWTIVCAFVGACSPFGGGGAFNCSDSSQCKLAGVQGMCQPTNMCSFTDSGCPSNQRYGSVSGSLSGTCVGALDMTDATVPVDLPPGDTMRALIDATCMVADIDFCAASNGGPFEPSGPFDIAGIEVINTNTSGGDPRCQNYQQAGGTDVCLLLVSSVEITAGSSLTAIGSRPLMIASSSTMTISGKIDVSSNHNNQKGAGANFNSNCNDNATNAASDNGGSSGGAGGSFAAKGGNSGIGDNDQKDAQNKASAGTAAGANAGDATSLPTFERGGCQGRSGANDGIANGGSGGDSGGAVWLLANGAIIVDGTGAILAGGRGGRGGEFEAGGGGGGTGGFIRLISNASITIQGTLVANGGAGGQGGGNSVLATGGDGEDGRASNQAARGGAGSPGAGGNGGDGGTNDTGKNSPDANAASGGGGGGTGFIQLLGTSTTTGSTISPPAM